MSFCLFLNKRRAAAQKKHRTSCPLSYRCHIVVKLSSFLLSYKYIFVFFGDVVQLVERLLCTQEVIGSSPFISKKIFRENKTTEKNRKTWCLFWKKRFFSEEGFLKNSEEWFWRKRLSSERQPFFGGVKKNIVQWFWATALVPEEKKHSEKKQASSVSCGAVLFQKRKSYITMNSSTLKNHIVVI